MDEYIEPKLKNELISSLNALKSKNLSIQIENNNRVTSEGVLTD